MLSRGLLIVVALLWGRVALFADIRALLGRIDALHDEGRFADARQLSLDSVAATPTGAERAELYVRAARETLKLGQQAEDRGTPAGEVLRICEDGEAYADAAIQADPGNDLGYYWKAANMGRWGQVKGMLYALFMTGPVRDLLSQEVGINPRRSDAYSVLGQLYRMLPGWPISFGNVDAAVSLERESVDLRVSQVRSGEERTMDYSFTVELARSLFQRNWSAETRLKEQESKRARYQGAATALERGFDYEGIVTLPPFSDREEARRIVEQTITQMEAMPRRTADDEETLADAKGLLKSW